MAISVGSFIPKTRGKMVRKPNRNCRSEREIHLPFSHRLSSLNVSEGISGIFIPLNKQYVENLQDTERLNNQHRHVPTLLIIPCCFPQGYTFPWQRPENGNQIEWLHEFSFPFLFTSWSTTLILSQISSGMRTSSNQTACLGSGQLPYEPPSAFALRRPNIDFKLLP